MGHDGYCFCEQLPSLQLSKQDVCGFWHLASRDGRAVGILQACQRAVLPYSTLVVRASNNRSEDPYNGIMDNTNYPKVFIAANGSLGVIIGQIN